MPIICPDVIALILIATMLVWGCCTMAGGMSGREHE
jgi:hypothetical protein